MRTIDQHRYNGYFNDSFTELNTSSEIKEIQQFLIQKGYNLGRWGADGDMGRVTKQAIYDYIKSQQGGSQQPNYNTPTTPTTPASTANLVREFKSIFNRKNYVFQDDELRLNIIGIRNLDANADLFDDELVVIWKENGAYQVKRYPFTTDPGKGYLQSVMLNPKGTAILKAGQYRNTYKLALHRSKYIALAQRNGPVTVYRDNNKNGSLDFMVGNQDTGYFGINIHKAGTNSTRVNKSSAGCQVFKRAADFNELISLCKKSERKYGAGTKFTYTLLEKRGVSIL
ncbi:peptidoglycan-binding protein [Olleya sp. R77988]|uniref:peptidoglycan-binding protein n=1 Tax=Olleya sp. R77988 TaxID=3093875 RepID=UPI0037CC1CF3